jgi:hypothetical protein
MYSKRREGGDIEGLCTVQPGLRGRWVTKRAVSEKRKVHAAYSGVMLMRDDVRGGSK